MVRQKAKDADAVEQFIRQVEASYSGGMEVTGKGSAGCELTFTTSTLHLERVQNIAEENGMFLDDVSFENHALRFFVEGDR